MSAAVPFRSLSLFIYLLKMFVYLLWSCDQDLIKQKGRIVDFQTICNSIDYVYWPIGFHKEHTVVTFTLGNFLINLSSYS